MTDINKDSVCTDHFTKLPDSVKLENYDFDKSNYIQTTLPTMGGLQIENDRLKQEVQRLREALRHLAECNEGYYGYDGNSCNCAEYANQVLQQDLTTKQEVI